MFIRSNFQKWFIFNNVSIADKDLVRSMYARTYKMISQPTKATKRTVVRKGGRIPKVDWSNRSFDIERKGKFKWCLVTQRKTALVFFCLSVPPRNECPLDHPFAFTNGRECCKTNIHMKPIDCPSEGRCLTNLNYFVKFNTP